MASRHLWQPPDFKRPDSGELGMIKSVFKDLFPEREHGDLAVRIGRYWVSKLEEIWAQKSGKIKSKDLEYDSQDPLYRIQQKTVVIAYADSVREIGKPTLKSLGQILKSIYPVIKGLHILPPCEISEDRFNDGGFSQIKRDRIHLPYGTNAQFEGMMEKFFSMTDLVLNHVDIENPHFQKYLNGDDEAGNCFYVFAEKEYQKRLAKGDFEKIFRPRPFPLFTIFRRKPLGVGADLSHDQGILELNNRYEEQGFKALPHELVNMLYIFNKIKNDQMLLDQDYQYITQFIDYLKGDVTADPQEFFMVSETQETRNIPYIFKPEILSHEDFFLKLFPYMDIPAEKAKGYAEIFEASDSELFGEPVRALTTFSHVQVDLNTSTYEGLKLLIDDFSWYLKMDLNMLRLDAANFAFKKWGTSCFGLPEVNKLLKILYLSMESVSPRMVPNLEVNAPLSSVLKQMANKQAPPPMMYDFHLASMIPTVFNMSDCRPLLEIFKLICQYDIPHESIRFSLDESHDGKSVSGSGGADPLLSYAQRKALIDTVKKNAGYVKYKSSPIRLYPYAEFKKICEEAKIDPESAATALFESPTDKSEILRLKREIGSRSDIATALRIEPARLDNDAALNFFVDKMLNGREPYELCTTTRDALHKLDNPFFEAKRYLAFKTLAFALMGRHVKAIFFNDLMGLKNDYGLVEKTGELRNIKRTKMDSSTIEAIIRDPSKFEYWIAKLMNNTIALVDSDPSFDPRGNEARVVVNPRAPAVALVHNSFEHHHTLVVVNTSGKSQSAQARLSDFGLDFHKELFDNISARTSPHPQKDDHITLEIEPYGRLWIKNARVEIKREIQVEVGSDDEMKAALIA
jgi:hypothetical protein